MRRGVPRPLDLGLAVVLTAVAQLELWLLAPAGFPVVPVAVGLAVGTAAVAWRRVAPVLALVVGLTCLALWPAALGVEPAHFLGWFVAALALVASAAYHARRPAAALGAALVLLGTSIVMVKGWSPSDVLYGWLLVGGAWLAGRTLADRTLRAELSEQRAVSAEQKAQWRAAAAVAEERLRLAREMHDVVSHSLSVMTLHVSGVRRLLRPDQAEERAALEMAERTGREALGEMRRMLGVLRAPTSDTPAPGLTQLPELLEPVRAAGVAAELTVAGEERELPSGVELAAFRIVQEALTNVVRHAAARRVTCEISYGRDILAVRVVDDGCATESARQDGHGLVGMRERAAAYGGTVSAGPRPGGGWEVHAVLSAPGPGGASVAGGATPALPPADDAGGPA